MRIKETGENMTPIDRRLLEMGMTRVTLARLSGVPIRTLENWSKRAIKSPNVYQFYRVARVLGCTVEDLLEPDLIEAAGRMQETEKRE